MSDTVEVVIRDITKIDLSKNWRKPNSHARNKYTEFKRNYEMMPRNEIGGTAVRGETRGPMQGMIILKLT